jgi:Protein of unknown function (DUF3616)
MTMSQARSLILALLLAFMLPETIAAADPPAVSPESVTWTVAGAFSFEKKPAKTRESLSGIACPPPSESPRRCIAAFDEGIEARYVTVDKGTFVPESDRIVLLAGGKELDAEGAARDGDAVYITGSQSPFRSPCAPRPDSRHVFRFKVDQQTGKATLAASGKPIDLEDDRGNLWKYMNKNDVLDKFVGHNKCLGKPDHAVNIEGLAAKDGMLYFGFREPARDQHTYILPVKADELFSQAGIKNAEPIKIKVGSGSGIRDMLAVRDGFLLLIGPDDDNASGAGWSIALWDGSASKDPTPLAALNLSGVQPRPCSSGGSTDRKPEAMTVLEEGADFYRLLILSDGMCDGGPMSFRVQK